MARPDLIILVAGTDTGVGKTWTCTHLAQALRGNGISVAARKPAQSFDSSDQETDADMLARATNETPEIVCRRTRWYEEPLAPPIAAEALGRPEFTIADLVAELEWPGQVGAGLIESAGGVRSPLAIDGDTVELADAIGPDLVIVVAGAGLGTLNSVRLASDALRRHRALVFLNHFEPEVDLHRRNLEWLVERDGLTVTSSIATTVKALLCLTRTPSSPMPARHY